MSYLYVKWNSSECGSLADVPSMGRHVSAPLAVLDRIAATPAGADSRVYSRSYTKMLWGLF
jgi:hypothetical protein